MKISFGDVDLGKKGAVIVGVAADKVLTDGAKALEAATGGAVGRAIDASRFSGKHGETLEILAPAGVAARRIVLLGLGDPKKLTASQAEALGGAVYAALASGPETGLSVVVDALDGAPISAAEVAAHAAYGLSLRAWRFDKYRTKQKKDEKPQIEKAQFQLAARKVAEGLYAELAPVADAVGFARELVAEPGGALTPELYADRLQSLSKLGVDVEVLKEKELKKLGMGALLGVAQGSVNKPCVVALRWNGRDDESAPLALVGKGVTFDSGGLSLKPAKSMEDMKWDMAGSAAVAGAVMALAGRKAKVNVVGVLGLVENMPSGAAQRPGDVVTSLSGQTIEVLNTDAEGRLVLADVIHYAIDRFKPAATIDLATLTGAIITALGHERAGLFASDDGLADALTAAGEAVAEKLWRFPLDEAYDKLLKSDIADMKNIGDGTAGSILGALFVKRFVPEGQAWAHLDIAGMAWAAKDQPLAAKGATGYGVRLLDRLSRDRFEQPAA